MRVDRYWANIFCYEGYKEYKHVLFQIYGHQTIDFKIMQTIYDRQEITKNDRL